MKRCRVSSVPRCAFCLILLDNKQTERVRIAMVARAPFLKTRFGGYYHRAVPQEDTELTHVGPERRAANRCAGSGNPSLLARSSTTCRARSESSARTWCVPRQSGAVGLLELHCPHRGTSLEFGLVGRTGIRCCYHGWCSIATARSWTPRRAGRQHAEEPAVPRRLSDPRGVRLGLRLYGPARREAAVPGL